jgi:hypothetical protein
MQSPTTSYHHGYNSYRRGSSTGVKSYFLLAILGWEVKTCRCTHHTVHYFTTDHPRGRIRQVLYPTISGIRSYPPVLDLASTYHRSAGRKGRRGTGLGVFSSSRPLRHHGVQGWPAIPGARRYSHFHRDRQNFTSKASQRPCLLLPYKRAGRGSTTGDEQRTTDNEKPISISPKKINISSNLLCTLIFPLRPGLGSLSHSL